MQQPPMMPPGPPQGHPAHGLAAPGYPVPGQPAPAGKNIASGCAQVAGLGLVLLALLACSGSIYSYTQYSRAQSLSSSWGGSYGSFGRQLGAAVAKKWQRNMLVSGGLAVTLVFVGGGAFVVGRWVLGKKK